MRQLVIFVYLGILLRILSLIGIGVFIGFLVWGGKLEIPLKNNKPLIQSVISKATVIETQDSVFEKSVNSDNVEILLDGEANAESFINKFKAVAEREGIKANVPPKLLLGLACVKSNFGTAICYQRKDVFNRGMDFDNAWLAFIDYATYLKKYGRNTNTGWEKVLVKNQECTSREIELVEQIIIKYNL